VATAGFEATLSGFRHAFLTPARSSPNGRTGGSRNRLAPIRNQRRTL